MVFHNIQLNIMVMVPIENAVIFQYWILLTLCMKKTQAGYLYLEIKFQGFFCRNTQTVLTPYSTSEEYVISTFVPVATENKWFDCWSYWEAFLVWRCLKRGTNCQCCIETFLRGNLNTLTNLPSHIKHGSLSIRYQKCEWSTNPYTVHKRWQWMWHYTG